METSSGARRRMSACLLAAVASLTFAATAHASCPFATADPHKTDQADVAAATVCLLNEQRAAHGLRPLDVYAPLAATASKYAAYMVSENHFSHVDESGGNALTRVLHTDPALERSLRLVGENLAWGALAYATPRSIVDGWMRSPGHRANILHPGFTTVGVGVAKGAPLPGKPDAATYAAVFGQMGGSTAAHKASRHHRRHRRHHH